MIWSVCADYNCTCHNIDIHDLEKRLAGVHQRMLPIWEKLEKEGSSREILSSFSDLIGDTYGILADIRGSYER